MRTGIEKEKINQSLARLKTHGEVFEIAIDPSSAIKFRHGEAEIRECLSAPHIYKDLQSGELASEELMEKIFATTNEEEVAKKIILDGELHFNDEYKENVRNEKKKQIVQMIIRDGADAASGEPLTEKRIHSALSQAKVTIDLYKGAPEQLNDIINKIRPVLNVSMEKKVLVLRIPSANAGKLYGSISSRSNILEESWLSDGSYSCRAELSAGAAASLLDELKTKTHGDIEASFEAKKKQ